MALVREYLFDSYRTSLAETLMARLPCLTRTHSWVPMMPYMRLLWSNFCFYVFMLLFSFSIFSDRRSLKIEDENNNTKTLTAEAPNIRLESLRAQFRNIEPTLAGWNYFWLELGNFHILKLFEPLKFCCISYLFSKSWVWPVL